MCYFYTHTTLSIYGRFEEFVFELPEDIPEGVWRKEPEAEPANFQISVHHGQFEEMVAMATIDIEDLKDLVRTYI